MGGGDDGVPPVGRAREMAGVVPSVSCMPPMNSCGSGPLAENDLPHPMLKSLNFQTFGLKNYLGMGMNPASFRDISMPFTSSSTIKCG